ncbi:MAG: response regulator transcription factor [Clostridia bacterium]|nr:response regulator transcription factor [Clostridia bacterium]
MEDLNMTKRILCIDDDSNICDLLNMYLTKEGYVVDTAGDGVKGLEVFRARTPDLILLDIMMPNMDGWQVCKEIRKTSNVPIIMVTAKGETIDKVLGLELGADDFIVKPFDMNELVARIKAVLRRSSKQENGEPEVLRFDKVEISLQRYELKIDGKAVELPPKELELMYFLASNRNHVFTRDQLLDKVWGYDYLGDSRTVDVHIKRLREKLEGVSDKWSLKTVWGVGYKFETEEEG